MRIQPILAVMLLFTGIALGCDFQTEPVAAQQFYRSDGWILPPLVSGRLSVPVTFGIPLKFAPGPVPGLTSRRVTLDAAEDEPLLFEIPRQEFDGDGKRYVMSSQVMKLQGIWRYDLDGKIVAYTIGLTPVAAHRENGRWKVDGEVGCIFHRTFIDDKGDGVFRILAPGWMMPDLVPVWAQVPKKNPA